MASEIPIGRTEAATLQERSLVLAAARAVPQWLKATSMSASSTHVNLTALRATQTPVAVAEALEDEPAPDAPPAPGAVGVQSLDNAVQAPAPDAPAPDGAMDVQSTPPGATDVQSSDAAAQLLALSDEEVPRGRFYGGRAPSLQLPPSQPLVFHNAWGADLRLTSCLPLSTPHMRVRSLALTAACARSMSRSMLQVPI
jgi:hypothetical protein